MLGKTPGSGITYSTKIMLIMQNMIEANLSFQKRDWAFERKLFERGLLFGNKIWHSREKNFVFKRNWNKVMSSILACHTIQFHPLKLFELMCRCDPL